jgi:succinate dehydrogenase hydrophobic anchor subunit
MLGLQVVIEDYVHHPFTEWLLHFLTRAATWLGMALAVVYVLKIALGAEP